jgi:hypothetical protein
MRYVVENPETMEHLQEWAGPAELRVASFYFWNSGHPEQRSQSGLFRSLLFEILRKRHDLVRHVFPEEWEASRSPKSKFEQMSMLERVHVFRRVKGAFAYLVSLASDQLKLCFFIDGLDEYKGKGSDGPDEIINVFKDIPQSPHLKICLSSRPWVEFEKAFDKGPKLRLQDLTYRDIRIYVTEKLESDKRMLQLSKDHPGQTAIFIKEILSKANGVFLWVYLVVTSILKGLNIGDNEISDLQDRLTRMPSDLEDLYGHMLKGIDKHYIEKASRIFRIYNAATDVDVHPTLLELDLAVTATYADAMATERKVMGEKDIQKRCDRMIRHMKVACGGLLEAHDHLDSHWEAKEGNEDILKRPVPKSVSAADEEIDEIDEGHASKVKADAKVSYLHRTVSDYLKKDEVRAYLESKTKRSSKSDSFDPNLFLLMSYLINLKQSICSFYMNTFPEPSLDFRVWRTTNNFCHIAQRVGRRQRASALELLHEFKDVAPQWWQYTSMLPGSKFRGRVSASKAREWQDGIFLVAVRFGLCAFAKEYLKTYRIPRSLPGHTILMYAIGLSLESLGPFILLKQPACAPMVQLLLEHGENPNKVVTHGCHTVWQYLLKAYRTESANMLNSDEHYERWALIFKSMLEHDADINDTIVEVELPDLPPWQFESIEESNDPATKPHSLEVLIMDLAAKAPPKVGRSLRAAYQKRKHPFLTTSTPSPAGSSSSRKRPLETPMGVRTSNGDLCIEIDDDDDSGNTSSGSASTSEECLGIGRTPSPVKRARFELE